MRGVAVTLLVLSGCFFQADYSTGRYMCSDGVCPSGLTCEQAVCVDPAHKDASIDAAKDAQIFDAPPRAATCADPQPFPTAGGTAMGTTAGRINTITAMCSASVQNGFDAVYRVNAPVGAHLLVSISGFSQASAYVIAPCSASPATPTCLGSTAAIQGNPINVQTTFAGDHFIVVDSANAAANGAYTLTLQVN